MTGVMAPWWRRLRETRRLYRARHGDHLAAAVTFFTVLALVPLLMLAVSAVGFVLSSSQSVFAQVESLLALALPQPVSRRSSTSSTSSWPSAGPSACSR